MGMDHYQVSQLTDGIWAIDDDRVRCFLVAGEERALLLDSCVSGDSSLPEVVSSLTEKLLAGELVGDEPPVQVSSKAYYHDGVTFFAD